jgi:hypothetical protein
MKAWNLVAGLIIIGVCAMNLVQLVRRVPPPSRTWSVADAPDPVMPQERRFVGVRAALMKHAVTSPLGYVTDLPPAELAADSAAMREYLISQFVLAPWVIDAKSGDCAWVLANFRTTSAKPQPPDGFRIVEDFGGGVLLWRKVAR